MGQIGIPAITVMGCLFTAYLLGVWLLGIIAGRLRSVTFIKSVHTIGFMPLSGLLFVFAYEVAAGRITFLSWAAVGVFAAETVVLIRNHWRCPLTAIAEGLGSTHGQITDFFFPKWFADRVFLVYGALFVVSLVGLGSRLLG